MSTTQLRDRRFAYQPALDGLRAVAVGAVLMYHQTAGVGTGTLGHGGFIGVDVFFVLSGYLITSLLFAEHIATGGIALGHFWVRRLRRLAPALLLLVGFTVLLAQTVFTHRAASLVRQDVPWVLTYLANWHIVFGSGTIESPLSHTWSLGVEEQWYIVWPLVVVVLMGLGRARRFSTTLAVGGLAVASVLWGWYLLDHDGLGRVFFATDVRAQELLVGAALAVASTGGVIVLRRRNGVLQALGLTALAGLVAIALFAHDGDRWWPFGRFALAIGVAVVIVAAVQPRGLVRSVLALAPLVALGQISYGVYLFHLPIFRWIDHQATDLDGLPLFALRITVTLIIATLSYRLVEQPIRRGRVRTAVLAPVGVVMALGLILVTTVVLPEFVAPPKSPVLAKFLPEFAARGPRGMPHVLVVGGRRADLLAATTLHQPVVEDGAWVVAIGDSGCGLTAPAQRCRDFSDDLPAIAAAFRSNTVVLMLDEHDLAQFEGHQRPDVRVLVAQLAEIGRSVGLRRVVVVTLPCNTQLEPLVRRINAAVTAWTTRNSVRAHSLAGVPCAAGQVVPTPTRTLWQAVLAADTSGMH